jgi:hypothetical protein
MFPGPRKTRAVQFTASIRSRCCLIKYIWLRSDNENKYRETNRRLFLIKSFLFGFFEPAISKWYHRLVNFPFTVLRCFVGPITSRLLFSVSSFWNHFYLGSLNRQYLNGILYIFFVVGEYFCYEWPISNCKQSSMVGNFCYKLQVILNLIAVSKMAVVVTATC